MDQYSFKLGSKLVQTKKMYRKKGKTLIESILDSITAVAHLADDIEVVLGCSDSVAHGSKFVSSSLWLFSTADV